MPKYNFDNVGGAPGGRATRMGAEVKGGRISRPAYNKDEFVPRADQKIYKNGEKRPSPRQLRAMQERLDIGAPVKGTKFKPNPTKDRKINDENLEIAKANSKPAAAEIMERKRLSRLFTPEKGKPGGWNNRGYDSLKDRAVASGSTSKNKRMDAKERALQEARRIRNTTDQLNKALDEKSLNKNPRTWNTSYR